MADHTSTVEDYLKVVYQLTTRSQPATTGAIAARLGVSPPSVSAMLKRLEADGLVDRSPGATTALTERGAAVALRVVRRHRLLETFLHMHLGMPWHEVHEEAEVLEHAISDRLERRIDEALGHPSHDPHGDPIPPPDHRAHVEDWPDPLLEAPAGAVFEVQRVADTDPDALAYLAGLGIRPGVEVTVGGLDPFDGPRWVRVGEREHALSRALAAFVFGRVGDQGAVDAGGGQ